jgi:hypothetical protein
MTHLRHLDLLMAQTVRVIEVGQPGRDVDKTGAGRHGCSRLNAEFAMVASKGGCVRVLESLVDDRPWLHL